MLPDPAYLVCDILYCKVDFLKIVVMLDDIVYFLLSQEVTPMADSVMSIATTCQAVGDVSVRLMR